MQIEDTQVKYKLILGVFGWPAGRRLCSMTPWKALVEALARSWPGPWPGPWPKPWPRPWHCSRLLPSTCALIDTFIYRDSEWDGSSGVCQMPFKILGRSMGDFGTIWPCWGGFPPLFARCFERAYREHTHAHCSMCLCFVQVQLRCNLMLGLHCA